MSKQISDAAEVFSVELSSGEQVQVREAAPGLYVAPADAAADLCIDCANPRTNHADDCAWRQADDLMDDVKSAFDEESAGYAGKTIDEIKAEAADEAYRQGAIDGYETAYDDEGDVDDAPPLTVTASISRKVNLGNYESAEVFVSVSGITLETTEADIDEILAGPGAVAWKKILDAVNHKARKLVQDLGR